MGPRIWQRVCARRNSGDGHQRHAEGDHPIAGKRPLRHGACVSWGRETRMTLEYLVSVSAAAVLSGSLLLALGMARMARLTQSHESWER